MNSLPSIRPQILVPCLLASGFLLCTCQAAHAQGYYSLQSIGPSYIGLSAGASDFSRITGSNGNNGLYSSESNGSPYSLTYGSYFLGPFLGMELGYTDFGQVASGGGTTKANGLSVSLIGKLPLTEQFNLLGRVGTTYGQTDVSAQALSGVVPGSANGFGWSYGVGAELMLNPWWSVVVQYDEQHMQFVNVGWDRVSTATIGARLHF
jgi:OmpA-OmpF porin, OOP family